MTAPDLFGLLQNQLTDTDAGWSIGSFGAIGEFHQRASDIVHTDRPDRLTRVTEKGGIRLEPSRVAQARPVAFETLSPRPTRWGQGLALCLDSDEAFLSKRSVLTELGPDEDALRDADKSGILFDMGLVQPQIDFCIRTSDPELLAVLRSALGRSLFEHDNPAMPAILKTHPTRVVLSALGRVEVYQMIGGPDTGGVSPDGPHTHVLPKLLRTGRTHSANTPIPDGLVPCAHLHPASPVMGPRGEDIQFDRDRFVAFQDLMRAFGPPDYMAARDMVLQALDEREPETLTEPDTRLQRIALRNTLRQQARLAEFNSDAERASQCAQLLHRFDRRIDGGDTQEDRPGHEEEQT
ncbi:MAG: hypothetical protein AAF724_08670 [Pseudomonadota bacterium]